MKDCLLVCSSALSLVHTAMADRSHFTPLHILLLSSSSLPLLFFLVSSLAPLLRPWCTQQWQALRLIQNLKAHLRYARAAVAIVTVPKGSVTQRSDCGVGNSGALSASSVAYRLRHMADIVIETISLEGGTRTVTPPPSLSVTVTVRSSCTVGSSGALCVAHDRCFCTCHHRAQ